MNITQLLNSPFRGYFGIFFRDSNSLQDRAGSICRKYHTPAKFLSRTCHTSPGRINLPAKGIAYRGH